MLLVLLSAISFAQSAEAMFRRGNEFYQAKDYNRAIEAYENLVEQGYESSELYYNLGNSYYRLGKLGFAILYYEKAAKLSPSDEDVLHNLALANIQTADRIETMPRFFIFQWWESLLALFSLSGWSITAYVFYSLLLVSIVGYFFAREPAVQKYSVYSGLASAVLLAVVITILAVNINRENNVKKGIIIEHTVTAKVSPDDRSNDAFVIHEGLKVSVEDRVAGWLKIRLEDGKIGWLPGDDIRII
ncbi:MAG: tetratricopeptide repeat protein [Ignavibacteriaceae bacterium]